ncbi:MAG: efflux RND transporter periplasmic adaptor subunit [Minisyncoccia bacterium]|jgi:HlyD family secretion protein
MKDRFLKILKSKKFYFALIILLIIGYFVYPRIFKKESLRYVLGEVQRGGLEIKVSGTGEIIPIEEINVKSKVSGEVVNLNVKEGDKVYKGQVLAKIDSRSLEKTIKDQEILIKNLELAIESAKLNLQKLNFQYQNTLRGDDYNKALNQGMSILTDFYSFYPIFIEDLRKIYFYKDFENYDNNLKYYESYNPSFAGKSQKLEFNYNILRTKYVELSDNFKNISIQNEAKEKIIKDSYNLVLATYDLVNEGREMIRYLKEDLTLKNATHEKENIINNHFQKLTNYLNSLAQYKQNLLDVISKINSYHDVVDNYNFDKKNLELSIKQKEIDLEQAKNKLNDLKEDLNDYYITSPLSGILSKLNIKKGDLIASNQIIGTIITNQKIAKISLNEIDAAKVKVGQIAILTFDALPDLRIKGKVIEISPVGKEEQGVVSYDVKISLEKENREIKPGMSVNAEIIVDRKENVLLVPNSAIKSDKMGKYVEVVKNYEIERKKLFESVAISQNLIEKRYIKPGISNDEFAEVLEGLEEGEIIIIRTLNQTAKNRQQTNPFLPRMPFGQQRKQ